jgi:hypothetical protein
MPTSDYHAIGDVLHATERIQPMSVLDVGIGYGRWGVLVREILDVYPGRDLRDEWKARIDGIEIFEQYRNPAWTYFYDRVLIGDVRELIDGIGRYDLILAGDVIEHLEKREGLSLMDKFLDRAPLVLLTTPIGFSEQGPSVKNVHEAHRSGWDQRDLARWPHRYKKIGFTFVAVVARDARALEGIEFFDELKIIGRKNMLFKLLRSVFSQ